ncbi:MAG: putative toxin-antitoxin system toxin component, PIN family [Anaerolineae bacterium]
MPVVALVDTNVWISALINPHGYPARLKNAWLDGKFQIVVSVALLDELTDVLSRPRIRNKYRLKTEEIGEFLRLIAEKSITVTTTGTLRLCRDPDDDLMLETALNGNAIFAVSRDDDLKRDQELISRMLEQGIEVLSVQRFLDRLEIDS